GPPCAWRPRCPEASREPLLESPKRELRLRVGNDAAPARVERCRDRHGRDGSAVLERRAVERRLRARGGIDLDTVEKVPLREHAGRRERARTELLERVG